jgi:hypothetical protein
MNLLHEAEQVARDILRCAGPEADSPAAVAYAARRLLSFADLVAQDSYETATCSPETLAAIRRNVGKAADAQTRAAADNLATLY